MNDTLEATIFRSHIPNTWNIHLYYHWPDGSGKRLLTNSQSGTALFSNANCSRFITPRYFSVVTDQIVPNPDYWPKRPIQRPDWLIRWNEHTWGDDLGEDVKFEAYIYDLYNNEVRAILVQPSTITPITLHASVAGSFFSPKRFHKVYWGGLNEYPSEQRRPQWFKDWEKRLHNRAMAGVYAKKAAYYQELVDREDTEVSK